MTLKNKVADEVDHRPGGSAFRDLIAHLGDHASDPEGNCSECARLRQRYQLDVFLRRAGVSPKP
jgi:hypothetical protein